MTEEALAEAPQEAPAETLAPVEAPAVNTEVEDKARRMGWKPQEEYKGDPNRWTDAESFVKVGEERIPVMKENYRKLEDKYQNLEQQVKAQKEYQEHMGKLQYDRAIKDLAAKQRVAVEEADTEAFDAIEKQKEQTRVDYSPKESPTPPQAPQEVTDWQAKNPWFNQDFKKTEAAHFYENQLLHMPLAARLDEVSRRVNADFAPPKEQARRLPAVEGAIPTGSNKKPGKTWNDIPTGDRAKASEWIKRGVMTEAEYVKAYPFDD